MLHRFLALALATLCAAAALGASPAPVSVFPIRTAGDTLPLNGAWDFLYVPRVATEAPADMALTARITVPGHWELQGFCDPKYRAPAEGTGYYRRTFRVPAAWRAGGQRICLRFEGVLYGFDVWINGKPAGGWGSGYNPVTFDITDLLHPGPAAGNTIDVRVTTRNKGWEFDTNDCWGISGIYRDVFLFAVPAAHLENFSTRTTLNPDGSATLDIAIQAAGAPAIRARLLAPDGKTAATFSTPAATLRIATPRLWTAETPHLYTLELTLLDRDNNTPIQTIAEKIGLRQITIDGPVLKLNGTPVKLRGVNHHDIWPDVGRACTEAHIRRDLELMRAANINFIRTSHYPPHHRLLDLADEMGFYVMCEIPFGFGDKHLTDPGYQEILLTRARATVARDQNHPSIIVWSIGNENPITDIQLETGREVKRLDPTRPICFPTVGSYFEKNHERFPAFVDIYAPHYPVVKTLARYAQTLQRPVIVTEYAHALGLASERFSALWEIMRASPNIAGGAIWMFQDQGLLRSGDINDENLAAQPYVWPDAAHYYDTGQTDGMDGIVYSDRRPQTDYHELRKVYSPVFIPEDTLHVDKDTDAFLVHVENRHDFRALTGFKLEWTFEINGKRTPPKTQSLNTTTGKTEALRIPPPKPEFSIAAHEQNILHLRCLDETGNSIYERSLKIIAPDAMPPVELLRAAHAGKSKLTLEQTDTAIRIAHPNFIITTDRDTGKTTITGPDGRTLVSGIYPHTGRRFTEADKTRVARNNLSIWPEPHLTQPTFTRWHSAKSPTNTQPTTFKPEAVETDSGIILLIVDALYTATHGTMHGSYTLQVHPDGAIEISYGYTTRGKGTLLEAGLTLVMPSDTTEYRWLGLGPFPSSPGKETAGDYGRHHITRGDLNFSGNRRYTELAALTRPDGSGILIAPDSESPADIAVESNPGNITLSHNARIASRGNKASTPEHEIPADDGICVQGRITLIPLSRDWPDLLTRWLGPANDRVEPCAPYLRSYDQ